ncbi:MAG: DUF4190 domain-containing protein [Actinobacteria bacterium]|nr:MAG: DUF4190 domain-containing protein [Actinomycetota bacterium]
MQPPHVEERQPAPLYGSVPSTVQYVQVVATQPKVAGLAVASMVLGILGFFFGWLYLVVPVLAIIFGAVALRQIRQRGLGGKGMAITGLACGIISTSIYGLILLAAIGASNG